MHTVGLLGHTGRIGAYALKHLLKAHQEGTIKLIVLHRPSSDVSANRVPQDVERRVLDLKKGSEGEIKEAVKGLQVLVSAVGVSGLADQAKLIKPLSETPGFVTYMPPGFGPAWLLPQSLLPPGPERDAWHETFDPRVGQFTKKFQGPWEEINKYGVGVTMLSCGMFTDAFFDFAMLDTDVQRNRVNLYPGAKDQPIYLVTSDGLGRAIAEVVTRPPSTIVNNLYHFYDLAPTGADLISAFENVLGSPPKVSEFTEKDYEGIMSGGGWKVSSAMYRRQWARGQWGWQGERVGAEWASVKEHDRAELERWVKKYKEEGYSILGRYWAGIKMIMGW